MAGRLPSRLLFVADSGHAPRGLPELVGRAQAAGVDFIELRRKEPLGTAARVDEARACLERAPGARVLVNDRVDVALAAGAHGAHVGQDDLPVVEARELLGETACLGLSTHDEEQFARGRDEPVDYLALGPIFESSTKSGHAEAVGLERLARCCASTALPVIAIGGLGPERAAAALEAGASAVAVASALALGELEGNVAAFRRACGLSDAWLLTGLPGSGKSTVGRVLAERSGRRFVDLDEAVEASLGASVAEIFASRGEARFREEELAQLRRLLEEARSDALVVALGGGTLAQADCLAAVESAEARLAWLELDPRDCAERLRGDGPRRPLLAEAGGSELEAVLACLLEEREESYSAAGLRCSAAGEPQVVASLIWEAWGRGGCGP